MTEEQKSIQDIYRILEDVSRALNVGKKIIDKVIDRVEALEKEDNSNKNCQGAN